MYASCSVRKALANASYPSGVLSGLTPTLGGADAALEASPLVV